jgi:hypothetical protein
MRYGALQCWKVPDLGIRRPGQAHGVVVSGSRIDGTGAVQKRNMGSLTEHHIVVQLVREVFPKLQGMLVEFAVSRPGVI